MRRRVGLACGSLVVGGLAVVWGPLYMLRSFDLFAGTKTQGDIKYPNTPTSAGRCRNCNYTIFGSSPVCTHCGTMLPPPPGSPSKHPSGAEDEARAKKKDADR